ncbi:DDE_3 domain-containing protein [Trichonephila clavipes]|nr:DDE_3 domain-containing protein [Trichonephila clavipes]
MVMLDDCTPLHVFERGSAAGVRYRDEVLEPYIWLFRSAFGPDFLLMDDNARPHKALLVHEFLESEDIRHMDCPARSLDPNPMEDALGMANATGTPPGNENSVAERVGPIATRTDPLSSF